MSLTDKQLRAFAVANFDMYNRGFYDEDFREEFGITGDPGPEHFEKIGIVETLTEDFCIIDPFSSECTRFAVDPVEHYGQEAFDIWCAGAEEATRKHEWAAIAVEQA